MIFLRYSADSVDIEADQLGFNTIRQAINDVVDGGSTALRIAADEINPSPYEHNPITLVIELSVGPNSFSRDGNELIIRGSAESLKSLSRNLPIGNEPTGSGIKYHHHYDYISFPDHCSQDIPDITLTAAIASD